MAFSLRWYQQAAIDALYDYLRKYDDNPCIVIPTAGGKTPVIAAICRDAVKQWNGRVLILAHVKELLEQAADKLQKTCPEIPIGIYSAGLGLRQTLAPVIVAGIQSAYKRAAAFGKFDLVLIDEAHMIPDDGDGMYRSMIAELKAVNPLVRIVGLTATPYRLGSGAICGPDNILNSICFEVDVKDLIAQGFISQVKTRAGKEKPSTEGLHLRGGEFIASEAEALMDGEGVVDASVREIIRLTETRRSVLIFATGIKHAEHVSDSLAASGKSVACVFGDTLDFERDAILTDFKARKIKFLVNVNVLTTGFDAPGVDCVVLLRPTMSPGLYYQMVGRGFRLHPDKADCLVLDYGGNVMRHGPVDCIVAKDKKDKGKGEPPTKECPICQALVASAFTICPECGNEFEKKEREVKLDLRATEKGIISGQTTDTVYEVTDTTFNVHSKKNASPDAPRSMRVSYRIGFQHFQSEWICVEHMGFARTKAEKWWARHCGTCACPFNAEEAVALCEGGALKTVRKITVRQTAGKDFDEIVGYEFESLDEQSPTVDPVETLEREAIQNTPLYVAPGITADEVPF